jgi:transposase-like protein
MDPTTTCCPNRHCPARGQTGRGNIGIHAQKEPRCICHACHKTFSATTGTVFDRLRTAAETVSLVVTLLAHGCPVQAMVAAFGFDERTIADWWTRSGRQGQAVHASLVKQTPCGRTRILARCIPWSHRDILGSQSAACRPDTHHETGPRQPPHQ